MLKYKVVSGDTLSELAQRFGTTVADIQAANSIRDVDSIKVGRVLDIPATTPAGGASGEPFSGVHVVRKGDTLTKIAALQGVTLDELVANNPQIEDPDLILVGQLVQVPNTIDVAGGTIVPIVQPPKGGNPPWLALALNELATDVEEKRGKGRHNPRILEYHATTTLRAQDDETPWCSSFVNWCITQSGIKGTNLAAARSWLKWTQGEALTQPRKGAITIFWRGSPNGIFGHVAFYLGQTKNHIEVVGGNQGDQISIAKYAKSKFLGYRWPAGH